MADVLLTHSYHLPFDRKQVRKMEPYPPLGTLYAAGLLRAQQISVAVFDCMLQEPITGLRDAIRDHRPKIVAIYEDDFNFLTKMCLTRMRALAWEMMDIARQNGARVVVHGSDATDHTAEFLRNGAECVLTGESEHSLLHVVRAMLNDSGHTHIPGVTWSGGSQLSGTREYRPGAQLRQGRELPLPARDLIDLSAYQGAWRQAHGFFSLNLIASRGCPFRCNWCAKPIFGDSYQLRPAREVASEMKIVKEQYGADHLWFADDIFGLNRHWLEEFAIVVEEFGCAAPFKVQARADLLSAQSANALKRAGCAEVWMGVESGSQKILDAMDKGLRVEEVIAARDHLKREGIRTGYFLQLGYPGESWADIQKTIALVRETHPDDIGVSFSYPLPNTRFHERVKLQLGSKQNWSDSDDLCVMFKGTYTDGFYRAIRDALHLEVESRHCPSPDLRRAREIGEAWRIVETLEPASRNLYPTELPSAPHTCGIPANPQSNHFVPFPALAASTGDGND
jgi:anaerobic magnesium-protoporphyrin IX monomethyl ester cyclase